MAGKRGQRRAAKKAWQTIHADRFIAELFDGWWAKHQGEFTTPQEAAHAAWESACRARLDARTGVRELQLEGVLHRLVDILLSGESRKELLSLFLDAALGSRSFQGDHWEYILTPREVLEEAGRLLNIKVDLDQ